MQGDKETMDNGQESSSVRLYSLEDAARQLGHISIWTLRKHLTLRTIQAVRIGRRVFLSAEELARIQRQGLPSLRPGAASNGARQALAA